MKLSTVDSLIKKTAEHLDYTEEVIHAVIYHQWKNLRDNMETCNTLEVSGFGKFSVRFNKIKKRLSKMQDIERAYLKQRDKLESGPEMEKLDKKIAACQADILYLTRKEEKKYGVYVAGEDPYRKEGEGNTVAEVTIYKRKESKDELE